MRGLILRLLEAFDDVLVEPLMPDCPVVALDICVLLRLAGLYVLDSYTLLLSPYSELLADVFGAIVHPNGVGLAAPLDDAVQAVNYPPCGQREVHLDPQPFSVEVVQDIQQPKSTAVAEAIRHEVHRPGHIGRVWHRQHIRLVQLQRSPWEARIIVDPAGQEDGLACAA